MTSTHRQRSSLGRYGEDVAARHLAEQGMTVLDRNWRCDFGEVDLVALDGDALVACEVKTRRGLDYGTPLEAVTPRKLRRLRRLVMAWLAANETTLRRRPDEVRVDVVGVLAPRRGGAVVEHLRGVA